MKNKIHWPKDFEEAKAIQEKLAPQVLIEGNPQGIKLVAGADMSHAEGSDELYASVVVMRPHNFEVVELAHAKMKASIPYVPGYLSFREGPVLMKAIEKLKADVDLWFFDGQGYAHPRRFGLACHLGLLLDKPAIGVAKEIFIGDHSEVGNKKGQRKELVDEGEMVGQALRTRDKAKPIYVSPGHKIDCRQATAWVMKMTLKTRIPEPTRQAHRQVNFYRKQEEKN